jgi:hypothetical protein
MYTFQGFKGRAEAIFDCPSCGKKNRKRTFLAEHTLNPFNKNADGTVKNAEQVRKGAKQEALRLRDEFMKEPLCKSCEDALGYRDRKDLRNRRRAA